MNKEHILTDVGVPVQRLCFIRNMAIGVGGFLQDSNRIVKARYFDSTRFLPSASLSSKRLQVEVQLLGPDDILSAEVGSGCETSSSVPVELRSPMLMSEIGHWATTSQADLPRYIRQLHSTHSP
ncbi:LOW QUALITY PROTEIN: hypothetical protein FGSG_11801 [Fusarium graminearum PH-1]|uniref:hypothetical protein n=1 Tax=Gibberella zeae (strain ATCC MYA-4620 / CBS 123657 / FGSC 9075 / NRRL 31084 / PH-1) TaxID=229533 RepID=UPI00021F14C9|nr:LOW QUALITY PROTEIN: hypothetical protein FGSG_11801 [Fusarium graminearum PH-1]ESU05872.1 LOW QUALITY PROTEIN: hypothetical protein FGSG_11801 [Fusarium graminearum PH-1]|eukprot:XP_011316357.1 LOW QUALITY PROTEIN: hypothetical protein FGSG_11801 [Fusarium graminearum PH-1]